MLDWIFEGIVTWISSVVSDMMDAVSGLFLQALGTDMTAMEEYFPFVSKAFTVSAQQCPLYRISQDPKDGCGIRSEYPVCRCGVPDL